MEYNFREIEQKWQKFWADKKTFRAEDSSSKPKYYVLDMFPYPSGAGLHVGHPLGYIASDIMARYKRHKGFNVLHPMGYDSFGLPAEQYAIQTGQHPRITTEQNIARYREQMDKIGFSFDWEREIRTSDPEYYKWTQWIFIQIFNSWYNKASDKAEKIESLISEFEKNGNTKVNAVCDEETPSFTAEQWKNFSEKEKSDALMHYRIAYLGEAYVNWCAALGTVLANDEVKDGVSERGGYPVERKLMKQWSMRITAYAQRLLDGLESIDWSDSLKESQRYWIGRSEGTSLKFSLIPNPSPEEKGDDTSFSKVEEEAERYWQTANPNVYGILKQFARENKQPLTESEDILWQALRNRKLDVKFRRQHPIDSYIADFISLEAKLIIEVDGEIHNSTKEYDDNRTAILNQLGFKVIRFSNKEVKNNLQKVLEAIKAETKSLSQGEGFRERPEIEVFTTRPDTVFGVSFVTLAPEHELVEKITTPEQKSAVEEYVTKAKSRSERERQADVNKVSGVFTGSYVEHPFTGKQIPIWVGDYVLAGYGTGAVMAVPAHDERDFKFATHFGLAKPQVITPPTEFDLEKASWDEKEGKMINSDFLNGLEVKEAIKKAISEIEKRGLGKGKVNFRLRDAVFGRQRYWGEPIPIYYKDGIPQALSENELPLVLPEVDKYLPTEDGEPPLARASASWKKDGKYEYETTTMPGWAGSSWYFLRYMDPKNNKQFASRQLTDYWQNVDLYIGGSEHATGHLLYVRFWTKFLNDLGLISVDEPAKKLINQGMIQGVSQYHEEIKIHRDLALHYRKNDVDKILEVYKQGKVINTIELPARKEEDWNGFAIYKSSKCLLEFKLFEKETKKSIPLDESTRGLSKAMYVKDVAYKSETKSVHTLKERWLKVEQHFSPIVFTDAPIDAYWHYKDNEYNGSDLDVWRDLNTNEIVDSKITPLWISQPEVEKMSKSKWNVITPDNQPIKPTYDLDIKAVEKNRYTNNIDDAQFLNKGILENFGTDTLRLYEMFLGPLEQSKPWNTNGITGVAGFLKKLWRLFYPTSTNPSTDSGQALSVTEGEPTKAELKSLHKTIKKITEDIERFSFNTSVSNFMICVNELTDQKCNKRAILEPLLVLISPYAPHIAEELWNQLGHTESIAFAKFPECNEAFLVEDSFSYPISFNGKVKLNIELPATLSIQEIEKEVMGREEVQKHLNGASPKKIIIVPKKIVNVVI